METQAGVVVLPGRWYYYVWDKKGADMLEFKRVCLAIEEKMIALSASLKIGALSYGRTKEKAASFIKSVNPWQFVNTHRIKKHSIVDLSPGAIQHSWEEDPVSYPFGNVLYEVQLDVTDDESTIRAFDKGKMQPDGTIRKIHVEDYFTYINTDPEHNDLSLAMRKERDNLFFILPTIPWMLPLFKKRLWWKIPHHLFIYLSLRVNFGLRRPLALCLLKKDTPALFLVRSKRSPSLPHAGKNKHTKDIYRIG